MVSLSNAYPAGGRIRAAVAVALVDAGRVEEALNSIVYLLDPLNPDGSAPLNADGSPRQSEIRGDQVKKKLALGFRDPDEVAASESVVLDKREDREVARVVALVDRKAHKKGRNA